MNYELNTTRGSVLVGATTTALTYGLIGMSLTSLAIGTIVFAGKEAYDTYNDIFELFDKS